MVAVAMIVVAMIGVAMIGVAMTGAARPVVAMIACMTWIGQPPRRWGV